MKHASQKPKGSQIKALEGCYIQVSHTAIRFVLEGGRYKWGSREIHDFGTYTANQPDEFSCIVELTSELLKGSIKRYKMTRRGKTYTVKQLPNGEESKFKRDDGKVFLAESSVGPRRAQPAPTVSDGGQTWKQIEDATAEVDFDLTGESVIRAVTIPRPPRSKMPTIVRVTHLNVYGPVDSDVFVRLGDPKKPLNVQDFDTVSDWRKAELVEDLLWSDKREEWVLKSKARGNTSVWSGTYEVEIQFPKGYQQIELKIISRVPAVCSIVLSNWKVYVR